MYLAILLPCITCKIIVIKLFQGRDALLPHIVFNMLVRFN
ncbi:hypothetical protein F383_38492 [Gossypium arboreum]|uniref:Uncharacterized protein n=1 Tax=Gossypium arboreum TaxID=29729 RepID=A0A0B0MJ59_GOSAR|nr:hypothetical protein F383_38492 [Gossypium arboreum]